MELVTRSGRRIEVLDEPTYTFRSTDNVRRYRREYLLGEVSRPVSICGLIVDEVPEAVIGAAAGATSIHEKSALVVDESLYLSVCDHIACFDLNPVSFRWGTKVDFAACFGVYFDASRDALISHGEVEIARLSREGRILWSVSGEDIFSEGFSLRPSYIEAIDFNGRKYRFSYDNGHAI
jgi:hypothetical protein